MASSVTVQEAKAHLEELMARVAQGEEVVIAETEGKSAVKLVPLTVEPKVMSMRELYGSNFLGITYIAPDFDESLTNEEIEELGL